MSEGPVVKSCIDWLCLHGCSIIRNNTGAFKSVYQRKDGTQGVSWVRYGRKGSGDILACSPKGRWIECECKDTGKHQQPEQIARQAEIERLGGVYIVAYSADDLESRKKEILGWPA